jgi:F-type H+-transporting ATPase subunit gamma
MTLAEIEARTRNVRGIRAIVSTMRSLSAVHLRHGSEALTRLREHEAAIRDALQRIPAPALAPAQPTRLLLIAFGSDQGMCGPMTRRLVDRATMRLEVIGAHAVGVVAVGRRTRDLFEARGVVVSRTHDAPTSLPGVDELVEILAATITHAVAEGRAEGVEVAHTQHRGTAPGTPAVTRVFPAHRERLVGEDEREPALPPRLHESPDRVAEALLSEWSEAEIYRTLVESLTAEHAARLRTTDAATHAIDKWLEALRLEHDHLRQENVTEEILEIVSGSLAVGS